jgi:O-antigen ligase
VRLPRPDQSVGARNDKLFMFELKLEKITKILLYAAPFLPLIFISGFYYPFVITKTIYFRLVIELALSFYFLLLALNFKKYRPRFEPIFLLTAIFFLTQLLAAIFGYDFYKSFWSDFERMEGVISLIYFLAYLYLLKAFFRDKKDWLFYIRLILMAASFVSLYGLLQKFNLLPVFEAGINRVTSTVGNAAFLAGYLLLAIGLGVYYYLNEENKKYKYFALFSIGLNFIVLMLTSTRGAILGLAIGTVIFVVLNAIFLSGTVKKRYLISLVIMAALAGGFFLLRGRLADSKIDFVRRMSTISLNDGSIKNRLTVWRMALKDFKFHPILGIGMENFEVIYNKYFTPDISENWFDRTHNVYLDELTSAGLLGLMAYLAILFYLFRLLFKKRRTDYWQFAVLTSLLIAYSIHNFFVFDTINTSFLYFFLIAFISFKVFEPVAEPAGSPNNKSFNLTLVILIAANLLVFYRLVYLPVRINRAIYIGYYYIVADTFRSYENFTYALDHKFGSVEAAVQLNNMLDVIQAKADASQSVKDKYYLLDREKLEFASNNFPLDIKTKMYLSQLIINNYKDITELDRAEALLKEAMRLSPSRVEPYYLLYNIYSAKGEKTQTRDVLENLINKLPWYGGAKIMLMGGIFKEDPKTAEELFKAGTKQYGYDSFGGLLKIINYLLNGKRYGETVPYYKELIKSEPKKYDYRLDLAKVYYLSGQADKAMEQIDFLNSNSPETLKGYEGFINMLNSGNNKK